MSTNNLGSNDTDDVTRAEAEVATRKAQLMQSLRHAEKTGEKLVKSLGHELRPVVMGAIAVAALATAAGITVVLMRRSHARGGRWLPPEQPSALASAARGAGLFVLRLLARQLASHIAARLDGAPAALVAEAHQPAVR